MQQHRQEQVRIETHRHRITGTLTLARDGYRSRVSDLLNASERDFISLTDVTVQEVDAASAPVHHGFMAISRMHIVFVVPDGEAATTGAAPAGWAPPVSG